MGQGVAEGSEAARRLERLREFGLSEYASKAYLALLELGTSEARDVSRLAGVPIAKIYATLDQLNEKGLVTVVPDSPKKYSPVPFAEFVDRLKRDHEEAAERLEQSRERLTRLFPIKGDMEVNDRGTITVIRGRRSALDKTRDAIASAKRDLLVVGSSSLPLHDASLRPLLQAASARGVRVRVLVPAGAPRIERVRAWSSFAELRVRPHADGQILSVSILFVDGAFSFIVHRVPDDGSSHQGKDIGVAIDEAGIAAATSHIMDDMWTRAAPLDPAPPRDVVVS